MRSQWADCQRVPWVADVCVCVCVYIFCGSMVYMVLQIVERSFDPLIDTAVGSFTFGPAWCVGHKYQGLRVVWSPYRRRSPPARRRLRTVAL